MKTSWGVIVWTIIFIIISLFIHKKTDELAVKYINEFNKIEYSIKNDDWDIPSTKLKELKSLITKEKNTWYKLINHGYFNEIFMSMEILEESIYLKDKMISLQEIEKIKMTFQNLEEDECCCFNRIF